jgi:hypothetical protein
VRHCTASICDYIGVGLSLNPARGGYCLFFLRGEVMKQVMKIVLIAAALSFVTSIGYAAEVKDWKDLEKVHKHIQESIK